MLVVVVSSLSFSYRKRPDDMFKSISIPDVETFDPQKDGIGQEFCMLAGEFCEVSRELLIVTSEYSLWRFE